MLAFFALVLLPFAAAAGPTVKLDYGTFEGNKNFKGVDSFLGIPFAKAGMATQAIATLPEEYASNLILRT